MELGAFGHDNIREGPKVKARGVNEVKWKPLKCVLVISIVVIFCAQICVVEGKAEQLLDVLAKSSKLIESNLVLEEFVAGSVTTRVIVMLFEPVALQQKSKSQRIQNLASRSKLKEAVRASQDQVITRLDPRHVKITNRFSYIFGFSAEVTLEGLNQLVSLDEVVSVSTDMLLEAHLGQGIPLMMATAVRNTYNGAGLAVAICDTGIDTSHSMLGGGGSPIFNSKVIGGYDTGDDDSDPRPDPASGDPHGTACAGIAAGDLGTDGDYIGGVAHNAKLYALKISFGNGGDAWTSDMIEGWEWCITHQNDDPDNPIMIISTSFGSGKYTTTCDSGVPAMTTAAANAVAAGITLFVSSGNDAYTDSISWPACISHVNSIGAVYDANVGYHGYSVCVDPATAPDQVTCYSNSASLLTLLAPSHDAYTTDIAGGGGYSTDDYTTTFGGTSAACPYAAGAAAALQSAAKAISDSYLTPPEIKSLLTTTGDLITDPKAPSITKPRINLQAAVDAIGPHGDWDLVYTPVTPCRIVDTRLAGGAIPPGGIRNYNVWGAVASQGGNPAGCPSPLGEPLAAHVNMIAVDPTGKGNLQAFPVGAGPGAGLSINYNVIDTNLANAGTVKTNVGTGPDITVTSRFSSAHTVISVLGYYYSNP